MPFNGPPPPGIPPSASPAPPPPQRYYDAVVCTCGRTIQRGQVISWSVHERHQNAAGFIQHVPGYPTSCAFCRKDQMPMPPTPRVMGSPKQSPPQRPHIIGVNSDTAFAMADRLREVERHRATAAERGNSKVFELDMTQWPLDINVGPERPLLLGQPMPLKIGCVCGKIILPTQSNQLLAIYDVDTDPDKFFTVLSKSCVYCNTKNAPPPPPSPVPIDVVGRVPIGKYCPRCGLQRTVTPYEFANHVWGFIASCVVGLIVAGYIARHWFGF